MFCWQLGQRVQAVEVVVLDGSGLTQRAQLAFVEDSEDRRIGPGVDEESLDQGEGTIQVEERHMACQGIQDQVEIPAGQTAG